LARRLTAEGFPPSCTSLAAGIRAEWQFLAKENQAIGQN